VLYSNSSNLTSEDLYVMMVYFKPCCSC